MGGYIDLTPHRLRRLAARLGKRDADYDLLLSAAESIEHHEEVVDGLASREREKVQQQMGALRARLLSLGSENKRLRELIPEPLPSGFAERAKAAAQATLDTAIRMSEENGVHLIRRDRAEQRSDQ